MAVCSFPKQLLLEGLWRLVWSLVGPAAGRSENLPIKMIKFLGRKHLRFRMFSGAAASTSNNALRENLLVDIVACISCD